MAGHHADVVKILLYYCELRPLKASSSDKPHYNPHHFRTAGVHVLSFLLAAQPPSHLNGLRKHVYL